MLIELIIAMVLLSLVFMLAYGSYATITQSADRHQKRINNRQELRLLMQIISDDLQAARFLTHYWKKGVGYKTGIHADQRYEQGNDYTSIHFHAAIPSRFYRNIQPESDPGLHEVNYFVRLSEDRSTLELVRREDFYIDDDIAAGGVSVVLASDIESFLVEFLPLSDKPEESQESWQKKWESSGEGIYEKMPVALRLTLGRRFGPDQVSEETMEINLAESLRVK